VSRGASSGPPAGSVMMTPLSAAISAVQMSYGWQQSPGPGSGDSASGGPDEGTQVRDESIVPGKQLVHLSAGARVLILEAECLPRFAGSERSAHDLVVESSELLAVTGKEAYDGRVAVRDRAGSRRAQREPGAFARDPIVAVCGDTF